MWLSTQQIKYWTYLLHLPDSEEKNGCTIKYLSYIYIYIYIYISRKPTIQVGEGEYCTILSISLIYPYNKLG
jgi:hypothetical protein